jgi:ribonuclease BN (tRNA processing enzyme)
MLDDGEKGLLLDCGPGTIGAITRSGMPLPAVQALLISHLHMDHVHGFPAWLAHLCFPFGVLPRVYGPEGTRNYVDLASRATAMVTSIPGRPFGGPLDVPSMELSNGQDVVTREATFRAIVVPHAPEVVALAYRVTMAGRTIVYSGDTRAELPLMVPLSEKADVLVHEAYSEAGLSDWTANDSPGRRDAIFGAFERTHTRVDFAAKIAAEAGVSRLVLTHLNPGEAPSRLAAEANAWFKGEVVVAEDGLTLTL